MFNRAIETIVECLTRTKNELKEDGIAKILLNLHFFVVWIFFLVVSVFNRWYPFLYDRWRDEIKKKTIISIDRFHSKFTRNDPLNVFPFVTFTNV